MKRSLDSVTCIRPSQALIDVNPDVNQVIGCMLMVWEYVDAFDRVVSLGGGLRRSRALIGLNWWGQGWVSGIRYHLHVH